MHMSFEGCKRAYDTQVRCMCAMLEYLHKNQHDIFGALELNNRVNAMILFSKNGHPLHCVYQGT